MVVRYYSPFQEMEAMRRQFESIFDDLTPAIPNTWTPAIALTQHRDNLELKVQLPGLAADAIDIQASRDAVAITGEYPQPEAQEGTKVLHDEIRYGSFRRVVELPVAIEQDAIQASYADGILTLTLPKVAAERNKVVKVALNAATTPEATDAANDQSEASAQ